MATLQQDAPKKRSLPSTVFVIDDDSIVLRRVMKESLRYTNLGVLTAEDLPSAVRILEKFPVGAILADLNFRLETQDEDRELRTGLDFLKHVQQVQPKIPVYVMSMDIDDRASRKRAEELGLRINEWYDKLQPKTSQFSPWVRIERDLIVQALKSEQEFREKASEAGESPADLITDEAVAEKVRTIFNYPRITYLQYLPDGCGYWLKEPIEVQCWPEGDDVFKARATRVPLLADAMGEDAVEALDNLAELIVAEKVGLDSEDEARVSGYARFIKDRLDGYIEREPEK